VSTATARPKLGVTLYSFTREFHGRRYTVEELVRRVAADQLGPGLEMIGFQSIRGFPRVSDEYARWFRRLVDSVGLEPSCLDGNAVDGFIAVAVAALGVAGALAARQRDAPATAAGAVVLAAMGLILAGRRRFPGTVLVVVGALVGALILIGASGVQRRSSSARAGAPVVRATTSRPRSRISAWACRACAAKHSSPIGERMVRAQ